MPGYFGTQAITALQNFIPILNLINHNVVRYVNRCFILIHLASLFAVNVKFFHLSLFSIVPRKVKCLTFHTYPVKDILSCRSRSLLPEITCSSVRKLSSIHWYIWGMILPRCTVRFVFNKIVLSLNMSYIIWKRQFAILRCLQISVVCYTISQIHFCFARCIRLQCIAWITDYPFC